MSEAKRRKFKQQRKAQIKKLVQIKKLIMESQGHDRNKCTCRGCYVYNQISTIIQNGRMLLVVGSWDDLSPEEFLRNHQALIRYKIDKTIDREKVKKSMVDKGVPADYAENLVNKMIEPVFIIMWKLPPMGMFKEV